MIQNTSVNQTRVIYNVNVTEYICQSSKFLKMNKQRGTVTMYMYMSQGIPVNQRTVHTCIGNNCFYGLLL